MVRPLWLGPKTLEGVGALGEAGVINGTSLQTIHMPVLRPTSSTAASPGRLASPYGTLGCETLGEAGAGEGSRLQAILMPSSAADTAARRGRSAASTAARRGPPLQGRGVRATTLEQAQKNNWYR